MELMSIWTLVFGGASVLNVAGAVVFFKSERKLKKLTANSKDVEVANDAIGLVAKVQAQLDDRIKNDEKLRKQIQSYQMRLNIQGRSISEMRSSMITLAEITERQIERKKYAESHICTMVDCEKRTPPIGTYRSSSDTKVVEDLMKKLKKGLKEEVESEKELGEESEIN